MVEAKKYTIVARRGKDTAVKREISSGEADAWLDDYKEHKWTTTTTECGTDRVVSREEVTRQWHADAAASATKAEAARQAQSTASTSPTNNVPANKDKSV